MSSQPVDPHVALVALEGEVRKEEQALKAAESELNQALLQKEALLSSIKREEDDLSLEAKEIKSLKSELKGLSSKYEQRAWERIELEKEIKKLETNLLITKKKICEVQESAEASKDILHKIQQSKEEVTEKAKKKQALESTRQKLKEQIAVLKKRLIEQSEASSRLSASLDSERAILEVKLKSKTGISDLFVQLNNDIRLLQHRLNHEVLLRLNMENLFELEITDLHKRFMIEANIREEIRLQIEQVRRLKSHNLSEFDLLQKKFTTLLPMLEKLIDMMNPTTSPSAALSSPILKSPSTSPSSLSSSSSPSSISPTVPVLFSPLSSVGIPALLKDDEDLISMIDLSQDIESQLKVVSDSIEAAEFDPMSEAKQFERIKAQLLIESSQRQSLEEKAKFLEISLVQVEKQLLDERKLRDIMECKFSDELETIKRQLLLLQERQSNITSSSSTGQGPAAISPSPGLIPSFSSSITPSSPLVSASVAQTASPLTN